MLDICIKMYSMYSTDWTKCYLVPENGSSFLTLVRYSGAESVRWIVELVLGFGATLVWFSVRVLRAGLGLYFLQDYCLVIISVILCALYLSHQLSHQWVISLLYGPAVYSLVILEFFFLPRLLTSLPVVILCRVFCQQTFSTPALVEYLDGSVSLNSPVRPQPLAAECLVVFGVIFFYPSCPCCPSSHPSPLPLSEDRFIAFEGDCKLLSVSQLFSSVLQPLTYFGKHLVKKTCGNEYWCSTGLLCEIFGILVSCQPAYKLLLKWLKLVWFLLTLIYGWIIPPWQLQASLLLRLNTFWKFHLGYFTSLTLWWVQKNRDFVAYLACCDY